MKGCRDMTRVNREPLSDIFSQYQRLLPQAGTH